MTRKEFIDRTLAHLDRNQARMVSCGFHGLTETRDRLHKENMELLRILDKALGKRWKNARDARKDH